jgi:Flp pilus assembly secretin CpaC
MADSTSLKEFKNKVLLDLCPSESRTFNTQCTIARTCISDSAIAEPVVIARDQLFMLGKAPGTATLTIWSDDGKMVGIELHVRPHVVASSQSSVNGLPGKATAIPHMSAGSVDMKECKMTAEETAQYRQSRGKNTLSYLKDAPRLSTKATDVDVNSKVSDEHKTTMVIDLQPSHARTFRMPRRIVKTSISNPAIVEPILLSATDLELIHKAPGKATLMILDDAHNMLGVELRAASKHDVLESAEAVIPPVVIGEIQLAEYAVGKVIELDQTQPKMFRVKNSITRISISDPLIADLFPGDNAIYLVGKAPGQATLFIWDDTGKVSGIELRVGQVRGRDSKVPLATSSQLSSGTVSPTLQSASNMEIEYWARDRKYLQHWP